MANLAISASNSMSMAVRKKHVSIAETPFCTTKNSRGQRIIALNAKN
jgi:hypothetical protein